MNIKGSKIGIAGDGGWGTTLAKLLVEKGFPVTLWGPFPEYLKTIEQKKVNEKFLPEITLPKNLKFTIDIEELALNSDILIFAVPSRFFRSVITELKGINLKDKMF